VPPIAVSELANLPQWQAGSYSTTEEIRKDVEGILEWQKKMIDSKEISKFKSGAPPGYIYKDNIESGPVVKIKVDTSSKLIDWSKVKIHTFEDDNNWEDEEDAFAQAAAQKKADKEKKRRVTTVAANMAADDRLKMLGVAEGEGGGEEKKEEGGEGGEGEEGEEAGE
jgi:hypothetical protein